MDKNCVPRRREDVLYRALRDGYTLYDTKSNKVHLLNLSAAYMWTCCDGGSSVAQIASRLHDDFDLGEQQSLGYVEDVIEGFFREELLCENPTCV